MEDKLLEELKSSYNNDYLRMVNEQGTMSGRNNWDFVFRSFTFNKLAEFELRLKKLESYQPPAAVTA